MNYSESELVTEIKKRNVQAYEFLIQLYTKPIYYLTATILRSACKEDIEECVSDVLLEVWLKIDKFDARRGNFQTWIYILTKYTALAYRRKNQKNSVEYIEDFDLEALPDTLNTVERQVISKHMQEQLLQIINKFNKTDKELFIRRCFFDEKIDDLMKAMNLSRSAVDNRLLRSRNIIKEALSYE